MSTELENKPLDGNDTKLPIVCSACGDNCEKTNRLLSAVKNYFMNNLKEQFEEDMQQSNLEGSAANCDFDSQKKYEERLSLLNSHTIEIKKQLTKVEYYMSIPDEVSAKIKCEYLLKAVNELYGSFLLT